MEQKTPLCQYPSALEFCLLESLTAFPDDSHSRLHSFFEQSGESALGLERFRLLWTKALASSRLFGQNNGVDIKKLSQQLAYDGEEQSVTRNDTATSRKQSSIAFGASNASAPAAAAFASVKDSMRHEGDRRRLAAALLQVHGIESFEVASVQKSATNTLQIQKSLRGMKISWTGIRKHSANSFHALDLRHFCSAEVIYGVGQPKYDCLLLKTTSLMGFKLTSEKPLLQSSAWQIFSDLTVLSATQDGALTPFAVAAYREAGSPASPPYCLFVFENPKSIPLTPLLGAVFAMNLRKNSDIIVLWASQLGKLFNAISKRKCGELFKKNIDFENIFVREDGRLLLGNISPASTSKQSKVVDYAGQFAHVAVKLLKSVLCLSRTEHISYIDTSDSNCNLSFVLTEGSVLSLVFLDFRPIRSATFLGVDGINSSSVIGLQTRSQNCSEGTPKSDVSVVCAFAVENIDASGGQNNIGTKCEFLKVIGTAVGEATLRVALSECVDDNFSGDCSGVVISVKISVIPRVPVASSAINELIGLLESVPVIYPWEACEQARIVLKAQCMCTDTCYEDLDKGMSPHAKDITFPRMTIEQQWNSVRTASQTGSCSTGVSLQRVHSMDSDSEIGQNSIVDVYPDLAYEREHQNVRYGLNNSHIDFSKSWR